MPKQFIIDADAIQAGKTRPVSVGALKLLVCNSAGTFYVIENMCSHAKARLTGGKLRGPRIFCPLHAAPFDMRDGKALGAPAKDPICVFATTLEDGKVFAELPESND
ncbi:MAG: Rieske 2Fe-2S domain-containing protein [Pseudomonadota bacterium]